MSTDIEILIQKISRLPGLGPRSARRMVIHLLQNKEQNFDPILMALQKVHDNVKVCPICGNIDTFDEVKKLCKSK